MRRQRDHVQERTLALERVKTLLDRAQQEFSTHPERSHRYVGLARGIAMRVNLRLPSFLKRKFCAHCSRFLQTGTNARVRIKQKTLIVYCKHCKHYSKMLLKPTSSTTTRTSVAAVVVE